MYVVGDWIEGNVGNISFWWLLCLKTGRNNNDIKPYHLPPLPQIYLYARRVHILPATNDRCLIYVGQIYEDGFAVNFDTNNVFLQKSKDVLIGFRDATTDLYSINFDNPQPLPSVANNYSLALSTPSPRPSTIYAYSVNKMTKKWLVLIPTPIRMDPSTTNLYPSNICQFVCHPSRFNRIPHPQASPKKHLHGQGTSTSIIEDLSFPRNIQTRLQLHNGPPRLW